MDVIYRYSPRDDERVSVLRTSDGCVIRVTTETFWSREPHSGHGPDSAAAVIAASEVPAVARGLAEAMHEAAGLPAPIILERPELAGTHSQFAGTFGGTLKVGPAEGGLMVAGDARLPLGLARPLAAHIVARAEAMERAGPDPADVAALADVIRETSISMRSEDIARAILAAGWRPPERKAGET